MELTVFATPSSQPFRLRIEEGREEVGLEEIGPGIETAGKVPAIQLREDTREFAQSRVQQRV
jgi:hypothetical protein